MRNHSAKASLTLCALLALTALAGCTEEATGTPTPAASMTPGASNPPSTPPTHLSAPPVKNPLNMDKFLDSPCLSLTSEQTQGFSIAEAGKADPGIDPGCTWRAGSDRSTAVIVSYMREVKNGLSNLYNQNAAGWYKNGYFEPTEIEGYPAVYNDSSDRRPQGYCTLAVGVRDELMYGVLVTGRAGTPACKAALNVATEVLKTIKGNQ